MNILISIATCVLIGYLFGCINLSYLFSKVKGFDIRNFGSQNAGASNVVILMGKKTGAIVAASDILKAYLAVKLSIWLFPEFFLAGSVAASVVILGHIFPFYMGFRGGKGFASLGGAVLALDYRMFLVLFVVALFIALVTDYICFAPISIALIFPTAYGFVNGSVPAAFILYISSVFIWYRHMGNLKRIKNGRELKFSFLWNRKKEAERFGVSDDDGKDYPLYMDSQHAEESDLHKTR
ncbi:MAG TPA: glycerol-3-phosphate acyltransferase [Lachnospiraceae bacterium]|nr:glycerol-3-phosphate acyltransferase [Lachnospiraceae bacterium]